MNYRNVNSFYQELFGCKVYKLSLDGGFTCPNRDGTLGTKGCIFCSAYGGGEGDMTLGIGFEEESRTITFRMTDKGVPFDPLNKPDPDITLSAEEREIGGLGIFITKKTMDQVTYAYENDENVLTMIKKI